MTSTDTKNCQHCGAEFTRSKYDSTVNCPAHRTAESRRSTTSNSREFNRDEFYEMGKKDGRKNGHKPGFSGYRAAVFNGSWNYAKTSAYEQGFRDAQAEARS